MTNKEILEKAITKAVDGGWSIPRQLDFVSNDEFVYYLDEISNSENYEWIKFKVNELIYDHDFAKALWRKTTKARMLYYYPIEWKLFPDELSSNLATTSAFVPEWQFHLQQMVIADDPIAYLGEHLDA